MFYSNSIKSGKTLYNSTKNGGFTQQNSQSIAPPIQQFTSNGQGIMPSSSHQRVKSQIQKHDKLDQITNFYNQATGGINPIPQRSASGR